MLFMKMKDLIEDFKKKCPELMLAMKKSDHAWSAEKQNDYHLEGTIETHFYMVNLMAEIRKSSDLVKIACLLHDVGKPMSEQRVEDKQKVRFIGHEGMSCFIGHKYLRTLGLSEKDMVHVWQLISNHTYLYQRMKLPTFEQDVADRFRGNLELLSDLIGMNAADFLGRFSSDGEDSRDFWMNAEDNLAHLLYKTQERVETRTETKGEAVVLVGPPLSGKSTFLKTNYQGYEILSRDAIVMELGKGKNYTDAYRSVDQSEVDRLYDLRKKEILAAKKNVVFDLTHMTEKSRRKSLDGLSRDFKRTCVTFLSSYELLKKRNEERTKSEGKFIPEGVMKNMMGSFSFPLITEGFDEMRYVFSEEE